MIVDLHAHPANKTYLFGRAFHGRGPAGDHRSHRAGPALDPFAMRVDLPSLVAGGVRTLVSAIYLPEPGLFGDCAPLGLARWFGPRRWKVLFEGPHLDRTLDLLDAFETEVAGSDDVGGVRGVVVHSNAALDQAVAEGNVALVHAVEGGHSLDGNPAGVSRLFDRGVALLTLAHFYPNGLAFPVPGVPPDMRFLGCFTQEHDLARGLTPAGRDVIAEMVRLGMVLDLTHCTPVARRQALDAVGGRRPVVFSHVGVSALHPDPMNPTDDEIRAVTDTGGVIGVIFMNSWLVGDRLGDGLNHVVRTLEHLRQVGGAGCPAIGTDFDGFTDPPDDLRNPARLPAVAEALRSAGWSSGDIDGAMGANARRVLREGWGR